MSNPENKAMRLAEKTYLYPLFVVDELPKKKKIFIKNSFLKLGWQLGIQQRKFVKAIFRLISPQDDDFKTYQIKVREFMDITGMDDKSVYKAVKEIMDSLWELRINAIQYDSQGNQGETELQWLITKTYWPNLGVVDVALHPQLKQYLLGIKKMKKGEGGFSVMLPEELEGATCKHTERFYELLKSEWKNSSKPIRVEFTLEYLRFYMGFDKQPGVYADDAKYKLPADFKKRVIDEAEKEINSNSIFTLFTVEIETLKTGKRISGFAATIYPRSAEEIRELFFPDLDYDLSYLDSGIDEDDINSEPTFKGTLKGFLPRLSNFDVDIELINQWVEEYTSETNDKSIYDKLSSERYLNTVLNEVEKIPDWKVKSSKKRLFRAALLEGWGTDRPTIDPEEKKFIENELRKFQEEVAASEPEKQVEDFLSSLSDEELRSVAQDCQKHLFATNSNLAKKFEPEQCDHPLHRGIIKAYILDQRQGKVG